MPPGFHWQCINIIRNKKLLPPANEVWGKVICLQVCVCPQGVPVYGGVPRPGVVPSPGCRGCLVRGVWSRGGCLVENPPNGYCCRQYTSYWNAFLYNIIFPVLTKLKIQFCKKKITKIIKVILYSAKKI